MVLPDLEFEIVEANTTQANQDIVEDDDNKEEFDFPLFSFGGVAGADQEEQNDDEVVGDESDRGRSTTRGSNLVRISLRSPSPEVIEQSRPETYYFAKYDDLQKGQFAMAALTGDDIWAQSKTAPCTLGKVIDLKEYNQKVEKDLARIQKQKRIRPGKKKRLTLIKAREQKEEREKISRKIEKEKKLQLKKAKFQRRSGGNRFKKKSFTSDAKKVSKPTYRTE